jgi:hypothetical protein
MDGAPSFISRVYIPSIGKVNGKLEREDCLNKDTSRSGT